MPSVPLPFKNQIFLLSDPKLFPSYRQKTQVRKKHCNSQLHAENVCRAEEAKLLIIIIAQQVQNNSSSSPSSNTLMNQREVQKAQCSLDENVTS